MQREAKSVPTKWSKQKSNISRRVNARFFAKNEHNKYSNELAREVEAVPRYINVDKDSTHGGKFDTNRDATSGIVLVQNEFKCDVGMHKKNTRNKLAREVRAVPRHINVDKDSAYGGNFDDTSRGPTSGIVLVQVPREVKAAPRRTNVVNYHTHGGKFFNTNRDSTSGKVVLTQEKFKFEVGTHKKIDVFFTNE